MYTVEFESDASIITTLDQEDKHEDVEIILGDDGVVFMRQFEPEMESYQMIIMSNLQWLDIMAAYHSKEGAYYLEIKHD
jgi:hypothetical protein|tara:strand:- start:330 stop:566 length:237 start_codon:yes stop_codon:yes gene_type:complete